MVTQLLKEEAADLEDSERELAQTELKRAQYQSALLQCQDVLQSVVALSGQEQCRNALLQCRDLLQSTVMLSEQEPLVNLQSGTMESSIEEAGNDEKNAYLLAIEKQKLAKSEYARLDSSLAAEKLKSARLEAELVEQNSKFILTRTEHAQDMKIWARELKQTESELKECEVELEECELELDQTKHKWAQYQSALLQCREEGNDDLTHLSSKLTGLLSTFPGEGVMSMGVANIASPELRGLLCADDQDRVLEARMAAVPSVGARGEVVLPSVLSSSTGTASSTGEVSHWEETGSLKLSQEPLSELTVLVSVVVFPVSCGSNNLQETVLTTIPKLSTKCHLGAASEHHSQASVAVKSHKNATIAAPTGTAAFPQASNRPGADPASQCPGTEPASTTAPQAPTRPRAETANLSQEQGGGESCSNLAVTVNSLLEEAVCLLEAVSRDDTSMLTEEESSVPELALHECDAATVAPVEVSAGSADIQCSTVPPMVSSFMAGVGLRRSTLGMGVPDGVI
jgi:hypothetical protein